MNSNEKTMGIIMDHVEQIGCPYCEAELNVADFDVLEDILCPACQKEITVPGRLGHFILIEQLGRGETGGVFLAQDETLNRLVALKVMRSEYGEDPEMLGNLRENAQAMANLNHKNVVQVYSFGEEKNQPYVVMELMQGKRVAALLTSEDKISEVRALEMGLDVTRGLAFAAKAGISHGHLKPDNILLNKENVAKVSDFGLFRLRADAGESPANSDVLFYRAPEQMQEGTANALSDQYSLGAILFHALAGRPPYEGETEEELFHKVQEGHLPDLREFNPDLTSKTVEVIGRMVDKDPSARFSDLKAMASELTLALETARKAELQRQEAERALRESQKKKKSPLIPIMAGVALLIAVGIGVVVIMQTRGGPTQVQYSGPSRELHRPLIRVEVNNLQNAVQGMIQNNADRTETGLTYAAQRIPDEHAAKAWYNFLVAGMMLYAQQPEAARALLEAAANQDPIIFDGGRVPSEDPRLLAQQALGTVRSRDLDRAIRGAEPYYLHLLELAKGYEHLLAGRADAARGHFQAYAVYPVPVNQEWPYVLQSMASELHASRVPIAVPRGLLAGRPTESAPPPDSPPAVATPTTAAPVAEPEPPVREPEVPEVPAVPERPENNLLRGILANWNFTEAQDGSVVNARPGQAPVTAGELKGNAVWVPDEETEGAIQFDGRNARVEIPSRSEFSRQQISFAFRLHPEPWDGGNRNILTQKLIDDADGNRALFSIFASGQGEICVRIGEGFMNTGVVLPQKWSTVVVTFDGTIPRNRLRVFLDGNPQPAWQGNMQGVTRIPSPNDVSAQAPSAEAVGRWKGKIGGARVYDRALEPSEIPALSENF
ncbi:MAG: protein kinase [Verrucomicrobia bacterium]|nr:protein kinase [Verrucomicrobiota bacterium]MCH8513624.1 protein kinase [Kiritimatiellia bacterium]